MTRAIGDSLLQDMRAHVGPLPPHALMALLTGATHGNDLAAILRREEVTATDTRALFDQARAADDGMAASYAAAGHLQTLAPGPALASFVTELGLWWHTCRPSERWMVSAHVGVALKGLRVTQTAYLLTQVNLAAAATIAALGELGAADRLSTIETLLEPDVRTLTVHLTELAITQLRETDATRGQRAVLSAQTVETLGALAPGRVSLTAAETEHMFRIFLLPGMDVSSLAAEATPFAWTVSQALICQSGHLSPELLAEVVAHPNATGLIRQAVAVATVGTEWPDAFKPAKDRRAADQILAALADLSPAQWAAGIQLLQALPAWTTASEAVAVVRAVTD
jgi:hypothetical protein